MTTSLILISLMKVFVILNLSNSLHINQSEQSKLVDVTQTDVLLFLDSHLNCWLADCTIIRSLEMQES